MRSHFSKELHNYDTRHIFNYNFFSLARILMIFSGKQDLVSINVKIK